MIGAGGGKNWYNFSIFINNRRYNDLRDATSDLKTRQTVLNTYLKHRYLGQKNTGEQDFLTDATDTRCFRGG